MPKIAWFPLYLDDYEAAVADLTDAQHRAYDLLLFWYYRTGGPLPVDDEGIWRIARSIRPEQQAAALWVREKFFVRALTGWTHTRADAELKKMNGISEKRRAAIRSRWAGRNTNEHTNEHTNELQKNIQNAYQTQTQTQTQERASLDPASSALGIPETVVNCTLAAKSKTSRLAAGKISPEFFDPPKRISAPISDAGEQTQGGLLPGSENGPHQAVRANLPVRGGGVYLVTMAEADRLARLYPAASVVDELRKMVGYFSVNPNKIKTLRGMPRFINTWIGKAHEQNKQKGRAPVAENPAWLAKHRAAKDVGE